MFVEFTLFKKGALLVSLPLFVQLAFIWAVAEFQRAGDEAHAWSLHSKEVLERTQYVLRRLGDAETGIQGFMLFGDETYAAAYERPASDLPAAFERLAGLVRDNTEQQARVQRLRVQAARAMKSLAAIAGLVRDGKRRLAEAAVRSYENQSLMDDLRAGMTNFLREEERLDAVRSHSLKAVQQNLRRAIVATSLLACGVIAVLAFAFYRGISQRIAVLSENTRRLSQGRTLSQPIAGTDEIAELDRTFHEMAASLTCSLAAQRNATERLNLALGSGEVGTWSWGVEQDRIDADNFMDKLFGLPSGAFPKNLASFLACLHAYAAHQKRPPFAQIKRPTTWKEKVVVVKDCAVWWWIALPEQKWVKISECHSHADDRQQVREDVQRSMQQGVDYDTEYRVVRPDNTVRVIAARGKVYRDEQGQINRMAGVCWDLTERKRAEEEIRRLNAVLEQRVDERTAELVAANRDLSQKNQENEMFVYSVSHDLRSPLVNLEGFSQELGTVCHALRELLDDDVPVHTRTSGFALLDGDMAESIRYIKQAVVRMGGIIDSLLRLSRTGRVEYRCQTVDVNATVARVLDSMQVTVAERGATVEIDELPVIWGDPTALELVFANLVGNALKYLDPLKPGRIEIGWRNDPCSSVTRNTSTVYVRDNGLGIAPEYHERIFQAFKRVHPQVAEGDGMGLAIVRRIVERHEGKIWVESAAGSGSTFFVELPKTRTGRSDDVSFGFGMNHEIQELELEQELTPCTTSL